jgi:RNA polymerase sigma-70 factor (ECF subfamily)
MLTMFGMSRKKWGTGWGTIHIWLNEGMAPNLSSSNAAVGSCDYEVLRRIARAHMKRERAGPTLQATAVANEAYLRLADQRQLDPRDRVKFLAAAANTVRRVLVDHARGKHRHKRGGDAQRVTLAGIDVANRAADPVDLLALDDALARLAELSERAAKVVELRFFGGLSVEETAEALDVSPRTVADDWRTARAWLRKELACSFGT